ncbi:MAG: phosphate ABC transporter substrate-binding protein [bacterium]|nr:phosphate ABC transporter substrate-binding protein [bacterium]
MPGCRWRSCLALFLLLAAGCGGPGGLETITVAGSTSVLPYVEYLAEEYMAANPQVRVNVQGGGSTAGLQAVMAGAADLGMASRPLHPTEAGLTAITIAWDAIAVVVHPSNEVVSLSGEQIRAVFAGLVRDWSELGGPHRPVTVVSREEGSGTREAFTALVMGGLPTTDRALVQDSNGAVREVVAADPAAVGYLSLGLVDGRIRALAVDGERPTARAVLAGEYRLARPFLLVRPAETGPVPREFLDFVLGPRGQSLLAEEGLVPVAGTGDR